MRKRHYRAKITELPADSCGCPICWHGYSDEIDTIEQPTVDTDGGKVRLPLCEVCMHTAEDPAGNVVACGTSTQGFGKCHACHGWITWIWDHAQTGVGTCKCGPAWHAQFGATSIERTYRRR